MAKKIPKQLQEFKSKQFKQSRKNTPISYSHFYTYEKCPRQWYLQYVRKLAPFQPSIHTVFGTAFHETLQEWLEVLYSETVKKAMEMDLDRLLYEKMVKVFKQRKAQNSNQTFSSPEELNLFYVEGTHILNYLKKKRGAYFDSRAKGVHLAGIETLLYQEIKPGVFFKGYIDVVLYDERTDTWKLLDIKTSRSGWNKFDKADNTKVSQLILYKEFFSRQYGIDRDKIEVEYFIVKREIPKDADYPSMQRRVQEFNPPAGKIKTGQVLSKFNKFIDTATEDGQKYLDKEYPTNPDKFTCRFCPFQQMRICPDAVL